MKNRPFLTALWRTALFGSALAACQPGLALRPAVTTHHRSLAQEEKNRALVLYFSEQVFNQHNFDVAEKLLAENYIQHNPRIPDGRAGFIAAFKRISAANPAQHSEVIRTATDGDLVFVHVHSTDGTPKNDLAIVNIFRVENGKIAEHWDVIQPVVADTANGHTMF